MEKANGEDRWPADRKRTKVNATILDWSILLPISLSSNSSTFNELGTPVQLCNALFIQYSVMA